MWAYIMDSLTMYADSYVLVDWGWAFKYSTTVSPVPEQLFELWIHACLIKAHSVIFSLISSNSRYFSGHSKAERIVNFQVFAVSLHNQ